MTELANLLKYSELVFSHDKQEIIKKAIDGYNSFIKEHTDKNNIDTNLVKNQYTVYKVASKQDDNSPVYIGLTKKSLDEREYHHRKTCNTESYKYHNKHLYKYVRQHGGWSNFQIIELEKFATASSSDAREKEQFYIDKFGSTLNKIRAKKRLAS